MTSTLVVDELRARGVFGGLKVELRHQTWLNDCDAMAQYSEETFFVVRIANEEVKMAVEDIIYLAKWLRKGTNMLTGGEAMLRE
jgi:hypothetical protein